MEYGAWRAIIAPLVRSLACRCVVRLGNSGLKVSKIILGCMSYGLPSWQGWILEEEESLKHIKAAYDAGINAFDTANVSYLIFST